MTAIWFLVAWLTPLGAIVTFLGWYHQRQKRRRQEIIDRVRGIQRPRP